jgi:hypothetical protein
MSPDLEDKKVNKARCLTPRREEKQANKHGLHNSNVDLILLIIERHIIKIASFKNNSASSMSTNVRKPQSPFMISPTHAST